MEKKIKLLLVADTYHPKIDGTLRFMEEFIKRARKDFEVSLLVPNFNKYQDTKRKHFMRVSRFIKLSNYPSIRISIGNLFKIRRSIKDNDLVFIQGPALASYFAMFMSWFYKKKSVVYLHVITWELFEKFLPWPLNKIFYWTFRYITVTLFNMCDLVVVPYHDLQDELIKAGVRTDINVARLGVDIDKFTPKFDKIEAKKKLKINPNKKVIGYVGRVSKEKNVYTLVEAFQKLPNQQNLLLLIVGGGSEDMVEELKEIKNCQVTGFVHNVADYLQAMDIFVMPSLTETTSLATLEAMSTGLPVIATKVGFVKNYLTKNYNGEFFPRENPEILMLKMKKLLDDDTLSKRLSYHARKTVAYSFSWERSINKIKRILVKVFYDED